MPIAPGASRPPSAARLAPGSAGGAPRRPSLPAAGRALLVFGVLWTGLGAPLSLAQTGAPAPQRQGGQQSGLQLQRSLPAHPPRLELQRSLPARPPRLELQRAGVPRPGMERPGLQGPAVQEPGMQGGWRQAPWHGQQGLRRGQGQWHNQPQSQWQGQWQGRWQGQSPHRAHQPIPSQRGQAWQAERRPARLADQGPAHDRAGHAQERPRDGRPQWRALPPGGGALGGWRGDIGRFHEHDLGHWRSGHWFHGKGGARFGWWWIVGPYWYFYPAPVYPYPDPFVPPIAGALTPGYWYYCADPPGYYPYVPQCWVEWQAVAAY